MPKPSHIDKTLLCVVGPTAIGKTAMGIGLAQALETEIISADSRQFFKEMTIGTAVPDDAELAAAPHHFIQHLSVHDPYSVGDFERDALALLDDLFQHKDYVIMVGGSGLYVDAVVRGLDRFPEVDPDIRTALKKRLEEDGIEALQSQLKQLDPISHSTIDIQNPHRLIRALEISIGTGKPFSSYKNTGVNKRNFKTIYIGLNADRSIVYERINQRVDLMMEKGLEAEARSLHGLSKLNALQTVGYKELFQYFDGDISLEQAVAEIKKNSRRFAKRQGTWYRKNDQILWFDFKTKPNDILLDLGIKKGR